MKQRDFSRFAVNSLTLLDDGATATGRRRGMHVAAGGGARMVRGTLLFALGATAIATAACSSSSGTTHDAPPADAGTTQDPTDTPDAGDADSAPPMDACGAIAKSKCKPANEGSVVRGIVKFDPAHFAGKPAPVLRVFMHHQYVLQASEGKQGGHPHAWDSFSNVDVAKGEARFKLDMCELGTAMWSEENCGFNIVVMLDENGDNDPNKGGLPALMPQKGELVAMVPLDISCHKPSPCLEIEAKCADGEACTTYTPITKCACAADKCPSQDSICKL
jgi:hypothetical protein